MNDYTLDPNFWTRLHLFVEGTNVNSMADEEERGMILNECEKKLEELTDIQN